MAATYIPIASTTLSTSAASVTFSAIPATYTDLVIKASVRRSAAGRTDFHMYFNSDNSNNSYTFLRGSGSAALSGRGSTIINNNDTVPSTNETANTFGSIEIYVPNYVGSSLKPVSIFGTGENNATASYITATAGLWNFGASTITSITLSPANPSFASGSTFHLYGISNT